MTTSTTTGPPGRADHPPDGPAQPTQLPRLSWLTRLLIRSCARRTVRSGRPPLDIGTGLLSTVERDSYAIERNKWISHRRHSCQRGAAPLLIRFAELDAAAAAARSRIDAILTEPTSEPEGQPWSRVGDRELEALRRVRAAARRDANRREAARGHQRSLDQIQADRGRLRAQLKAINDDYASSVDLGNRTALSRRAAYDLYLVDYHPHGDLLSERLDQRWAEVPAELRSPVCDIPDEQGAPR